MKSYVRLQFKNKIEGVVMKTIQIHKKLIKADNELDNVTMPEGFCKY